MNKKQITPGVANLLLIFLGSVLFNSAIAQITEINFPAEGATLRELSSIQGSASGKGIRFVGISIVKENSDEEWSSVGTPPIYRWRIGPTGQWLETVLDQPGAPNTSWSTPSSLYSLPAGKDLPNGKYIIYAYCRTNSGTVGRQIRRSFTISR